MIHITIISVGKIKEKYLKDAIAEYSKRLSKYCKLNIIEIADEPIPNNINDKVSENLKSIEGNKILYSLNTNSYVISLDLAGKQYSSEDFSALPRLRLEGLHQMPLPQGLMSAETESFQEQLQKLRGRC